ncbi:MAG: hypothetical protein KDJ31_10625 [Candidatus Competibacteraceae bacterium]|nr:hypothetical protein [Candidatus Competibacteraceae bacterium]MCB1821616.1 hypothetical protein [Candidatus Competibacteraceae bacterium]HRY15958.1 hypothetical protein [Candidatus Competibacteraceae bacterium]
MATVYRDAVQHPSVLAYTVKQVRVWAMHPEDMEAFQATLSQGVTLCAVLDATSAAFGQLHPVGHLAYLLNRRLIG